MSRSERAAEVLYGVHPVTEAIEAGHRTIDRVLVSREAGGRNLGRLLRAARSAGVPVTYLPRDVLAQRAGARAVHQGVAALVSPVAYADPETIVSAARNRRAGLILVLDGLEDPRNLGAVLRTAAAVGVDGVLLGAEDTVGLTPAVAKTAAGALERVPVAREPRLGARLSRLKEAGFRVVALEARAPRRWDHEDFAGPIVLIAGGEGRGIRRGLSRVADSAVSLPLAEGVESLNVSVAVGAVLYEILRQRDGPRKGGGGVGIRGATLERA